MNLVPFPNLRVIHPGFYEVPDFINFSHGPKRFTKARFYWPCILIIFVPYFPEYNPHSYKAKTKSAYNLHRYITRTTYLGLFHYSVHYGKGLLIYKQQRAMHVCHMARKYGDMTGCMLGEGLSACAAVRNERIDAVKAILHIFLFIME